MSGPWASTEHARWIRLLKKKKEKKKRKKKTDMGFAAYAILKVVVEQAFLDLTVAGKIITKVFNSK